MQYKSTYKYLSSTKWLRCLAFVCCLLFVQQLSAQDFVKTEKAKQMEEKHEIAKANKSGKKVYAVEKKSTIQKFREDSTAIINGLQLNMDLVGVVQSMLTDKKYYEASARLSIKDWVFPTIELGYGRTDYHELETNLHYSCGAPYGRVGFDVNVIKDRHDDYQVFVGARAAYTNFKFDVSAPNAEDPVWGGNANFKVDGAKCNYLWAEFLVGVDARIVGPVHLGWTMRYKTRLHSGYEGLNKAWYVPGYGNDDSTGFGATFNVGFDIWDFKSKKKKAIIVDMDDTNNIEPIDNNTNVETIKQ